jgi:hypothetical protein
VRAPNPIAGRKPERHLRQMQGPRLRAQRTVEPLSAAEHRAATRAEWRGQNRRWDRGR